MGNTSNHIKITAKVRTKEFPLKECIRKAIFPNIEYIFMVCVHDSTLIQLERKQNSLEIRILFRNFYNLEQKQEVTVAMMR